MMIGLYFFFWYFFGSRIGGWGAVFYSFLGAAPQDTAASLHRGVAKVALQRGLWDHRAGRSLYCVVNESVLEGGVR